MQEEEEVISAHRKEVEDTMEIVREVRVSLLFTVACFECGVVLSYVCYVELVLSEGVKN